MRKAYIAFLIALLLVGLGLSGCTPEPTEPPDHVFSLDRSLIGNCADAQVTKSMFDSRMHIMDGETAELFFDTFLSGVQVTDNSERIEEVQSVGAPFGFPFQICFTCNENTSLLVCFYENGAITVNYENHDFASVQDNVVDQQAIEQWLKEHDAL